MSESTPIVPDPPSDSAPDPPPESHTQENAAQEFVPMQFAPPPLPPPGEFSGSWERAGRHPAAAAILAMLGIGVVYFYGASIAQSIVLVSSVAANSVRSHSPDFETFTLTQKNVFRVVLVCCQFGLMLFPVLRLIRDWHTRDVRSYIRLNAVPVRRVLLAIAATILYFPFNVSIIKAIVRILRLRESGESSYESLFTANSPHEFLMLVFVIAVTPAICEEIFFRGYLQRTFERVIGWKSIILIGAVFGLFHFQPISLITLSGMGFLFGFLYYRGGSLLPNMAAHFTNNFLALWAMSAPAKSWIGALLNHPPVYVLLFSFLLGILVIMGYWRETQKNPAEPD